MRRLAIATLPLVLTLLQTSVRADEAAPPAPATPPGPVAGGVAGELAQAAPDAGFHRVHITFDVLGLVDSRYALAAEVVLTPRDSIVLSGFYMQSEFAADSDLFGTDASATPTVQDPSRNETAVAKTEHQYDTATQAFGFELQYRRYVKTFEPGKIISPAASGIFLSPGFELQHFKTRTTALTADCQGINHNDGFFDTGPSSWSCGDFTSTGYAQTQSWWYAGGSLDVGAQVATRVGFVASASAGAHVRIPTAHIDESQYPWTWEAAHGSGIRPRFRLQIGWGF